MACSTFEQPSWLPGFSGPATRAPSSQPRAEMKGPAPAHVWSGARLPPQAIPWRASSPIRVSLRAWPFRLRPLTPCFRRFTPEQRIAAATDRRRGITRVRLARGSTPSTQLSPIYPKKDSLVKIFFPPRYFYRVIPEKTASGAVPFGKKEPQCRRARWERGGVQGDSLHPCSRSAPTCSHGRDGRATIPAYSLVPHPSPHRV